MEGISIKRPLCIGLSCECTSVLVLVIIFKVAQKVGAWRSQQSREAEKMVGRKAVNAENDRTRISQRMSSFAMAPTEVVYVEFEG